MEIQTYVQEMKEIQKHILDYIGNSEATDSDFDKLIFFLNDVNICENTLKFKETFLIIGNIASFHQRSSSFLNKIEKICLYFKDYIVRSYLMLEFMFLFDKRMILFLFEQKFFSFTESFAYLLNSVKYENFFLIEIMETISKESTNEEKYMSFKQKREKGENPHYICQLIREDLIDEFVVYVNKTNYNLNSKIESSIFETNTFLLNEGTTLIDYAAFFGSIQIFRFLLLNGVKIDETLWQYAVHSNNPELIHILEYNQVEYSLKYSNPLNESIKCFHNDFAHYFLDNKDFKIEDDKISFYHNYEFLRFDSYNDYQELFFIACEDNYPYLVSILLNKEEFKIDINAVKNDILIILYLIKRMRFCLL